MASMAMFLKRTAKTVAMGLRPPRLAIGEKCEFTQTTRVKMVKSQQSHHSVVAGNFRGSDMPVSKQFHDRKMCRLQQASLLLRYASCDDPFALPFL
jgi:hypothetical protein